MWPFDVGYTEHSFSKGDYRTSNLVEGKAMNTGVIIFHTNNLIHVNMLQYKNFSFRFFFYCTFNAKTRIFPKITTNFRLENRGDTKAEVLWKKKKSLRRINGNFAAGIFSVLSRIIYFIIFLLYIYCATLHNLYAFEVLYI